jgi:Uma2 family endonuclease
VELWEGELQEVPGAGGQASNIAGEIYALLGSHVRSGKRGLLTTADGTSVFARGPYTVLVPDVAFVRWGRLPGGVAPEKHIPACRTSTPRSDRRPIDWATEPQNSRSGAGLGCR